jgi:hypothetical protein
MNTLSPGAAALYNNINAALAPSQLDDLAQSLWAHWGKGDLTDEEATFLGSAIAKRRPGGGIGGARGLAKPIGKLNGPVGSRFVSRQRPRSPDRQASRDRRRCLGGSSALPANLRHHYTEGQRAVLCIIAGEVKHHGICDLPIDKIAALAGVCRTTVQTTLHEARRLHHIRVTERPVRGRKHLPNVVEIIAREWRAWIKGAPTAHRPIGSKVVNLVSTTKSTDSQKKRGAPVERQQEAMQGVPWQRSEPPDRLRVGV